MAFERGEQTELAFIGALHRADEIDCQRVLRNFVIATAKANKPRGRR